MTTLVWMFLILSSTVSAFVSFKITALFYKVKIRKMKKKMAHRELSAQECDATDPE